MRLRAKRKAASHSTGLPVGAKLGRHAEVHSQWGWVFTEVTIPSQISNEHCQATCGFSTRNAHQMPICSNKHSPHRKTPGNLDRSEHTPSGRETASSTPSSEIINLTDDGKDTMSVTPCSKKNCRNNPNCLNYLGQHKWKDEALAQSSWLEASSLGEDPQSRARNLAEYQPVGLKNLGATCYVNACIQVWFQDVKFRTGVYQCQLPTSTSRQPRPEDSPLFQLQVTFAALANLKENVHNPVQLIESLHLDTSEQQDAQEFSKLFLNLLADEFQKQQLPSLKSLISDQFEGLQIYGTRCKTCLNVSERESTFLELEVNLQEDCKLEDCVARMLEPEALSGDNRYLCSNCSSLEDATRYTEIKKLPPVLHFSLLRFVFDVKNGCRKKSKANVSFPPILDMDQFLRSHPSPDPSGIMQGGIDAAQPSANVYVLKGILLHKGPSAYHGHYEAQVMSQTGRRWYRFNDEQVTPIDPFETQKETIISKAHHAKTPVNRKAAVLNDNEGSEGVGNHGRNYKSSKADLRYMNSKDAYMLIYTRRDPTSTVEKTVVPSTSSTAPRGERPLVHSHKEELNPPLYASQVIKGINDTFDREIEEYLRRKQDAVALFTRVRLEKLDIMRTWEVRDHQETSVVIDSQSLEGWVEEGLVSKNTYPAPPEEGVTPISLNSELIESPSLSASPTTSRAHRLSSTEHFHASPDEASVINNARIICAHGKLDPVKYQNMKRINMVAYDRMLVLSGHRASPEMRSTDICEVCVEHGFRERIYALEHPNQVEEFGTLNMLDSEKTVYISKVWLRGWRENLPKFHNSHHSYHGDPPPDALHWRAHVLCEHNGLTLNQMTRTRITPEAATFLMGLFPSWEPPTTDINECDVCSSLVSKAQQDHERLKHAADLEKINLKELKDRSTPIELSQSIGTFFVVKSNFLQSWRLWLSKPTTHLRPSIDNSELLCGHGLLLIDLGNSVDLRVHDICFLRDEEWQILSQRYEAMHPICTNVAKNSEGMNIITSNIQTCYSCRLDRLSGFQQTNLIVHLIEPNTTLPQMELRNSPSGLPYPSSPSSTTTASTKNVGGKKRGVPESFHSSNRKSKRLQRMKAEALTRIISVSKMDTVKDLKMKIHDEFEVPTLHQTLYYNGLELQENSATVAHIGIFAYSDLHVQVNQPAEYHDVEFMLDYEHDGVSQKDMSHGAFSGTLLGARNYGELEHIVLKNDPSSSLHGDSLLLKTNIAGANSSLVSGDQISCSSCTYLNSLDRATCAICLSPL